MEKKRHILRYLLSILSIKFIKRTRRRQEEEIEEEICVKEKLG